MGKATVVKGYQNRNLMKMRFYAMELEGGKTLQAPKSAVSETHKQDQTSQGIARTAVWAEWNSQGRKELKVKLARL